MITQTAHADLPDPIDGTDQPCPTFRSIDYDCSGPHKIAGEQKAGIKCGFQAFQPGYLQMVKAHYLASHKIQNRTRTTTLLIEAQLNKLVSSVDDSYIDGQATIRTVASYNRLWACHVRFTDLSHLAQPAEKKTAAGSKKVGTGLAAYTGKAV